MKESRKSQKAQIKKPLLSTPGEEEKEGEVTDLVEGGMSLNSLNRSVINPSERLRRFLNTIGLNLEDLSAFVTKQGEDPEIFIQHLQQLFDHEKSCSSGFKWAALDHLVEKYLQWPLLSQSDLSGDSQCCTARVKPAQRSVLLKSFWGLMKAYGVRGFVKGVEFTLSRTVRYFIYSMVTYRMLTWYQTGRLELQEFRQVFDKNTEKGIDTLVRELSKVPPLYLNLILCSPLIIGGLYALNGMRGAKAVRPEEIEQIASDLLAQLEPIPVEEKRDFVLVPEPRIGFMEGLRFKRVAQERDHAPAPTATQSKSSRNFLKNTLQEFFPPFSWFSITTQLQKLEKLIRWDERISPKERLQLFDVLRQTAQKSHQLTQIHAMECLAKIAHGIGLKDLKKLEKAGYSPEVLQSIVYTKTLALQTLSELTASNPDHPILAIPRRVYATYLLWWLGLSTSYRKQKIPFSVFKALKTALEISFLYQITKSIVRAIDCPDKLGYKFAEGYAEWASDYTAECFNTRLSLFRSVDPNESFDALMAEVDRYHLADLTDLTLQKLNASEFKQLLHRVTQKAPYIETIQAYGNQFDTFQVGTFHGLNRLKYFFFEYNALTTLLDGAFEGLDGLEVLDLESNNLRTLSNNTFRGLAQLQELDLMYNKLADLPPAIFKELIGLKDLVLDFNRFTTLAKGIFDPLVGLQTLSLGFNQLNALSADIFNRLQDLYFLNLEVNQLTTLPDDLFDELSQLEALYLHANPLTTIPLCVSQILDQLIEFGLDGSLISPEMFDNLTHLEGLGLSGLTTVPWEITKLNRLLYLYLDRNSFNSLPEGMFANFSQLRQLRLQSDQLMVLSGDSFQGLNQLNELIIYGCSLTPLPANVFNPLNQLQTLALVGNELMTLPADIFNRLKQLEGVYLSANQLMTLPMGIFNPLEKLKTLDLGANQLNDTVIFNLTQSFPYQLKELVIDYNFISDKGMAALVKILPCTSLTELLVIPSRLSINDTSLLQKAQKELLEKVCSDRLCHANLPPAVSCPAHFPSNSIDAAADVPVLLGNNPTWLYGLPAPLNWVSTASPALPTLSSCSQASNRVVMTAGGSALVVGSVGLGILFYKNCTILQSFVNTSWNFVIRCCYGKAQKLPADSVETSPSVPPTTVKTQTKKSSICNLFGTFFKSATTPSRNLDVQVDSQQLYYGRARIG